MDELKQQVQRLIDSGVPEKEIGAFIQRWTSEPQKIDAINPNPEFQQEPDYSGLPVGEPSYGAKAVGKTLEVIDYPRKAIVESTPVDETNPYFVGEKGGLSPSDIAGKVGEAVLGKGASAEAMPFEAAKEEKFGLANEVGRIGLDLATTYPYFKGLGKLFKGVSEQAALIRANKLISKADSAISSEVRKGIEKGIKPYFSGKKTYPQIKKYYDKATNAVKTIIQYSEGSLPTSVEEMSQAIYNTKQKIFAEYSMKTLEAGESGVMVDIQPILDELEDIAKGVERIRGGKISKAIREEAEGLAIDGTQITPEEAERLASNYNSMGQAFWNNPNPNDLKMAVVDARIGSQMSKQIQSALKDAGEEYANLRKQYGALTEIERDTARRAITWGRRNAKGFFDLAEIYATGRFVEGLISFNPGEMVSAAAIYAHKGWAKRKNNVDLIIEKMFSNTDDIIKKQNELEGIIK